MEYNGFTLDAFQKDAISSINKGNSVVVSAATGTGKTLIADYVIDMAIQHKWRVIYTAPIKALSNQKFRDFKQQYGDNVGLLTGDVVINPTAPICIMTTEIYRNMLLDNESFDDLRYVIFDEIHFINDPERGTVWEESIIFSPNHVRFVCLSATIPNYDQFAAWIAHIKNHQVDTVFYGKRAVPLSHHFFDVFVGLSDFAKLKESKHLADYPSRNRRGKPEKIKPADHRDLVRELKNRDWLPCVFFVFSRLGTWQCAQEAARKYDLVDAKQKSAILSYVQQHMHDDVKKMKSAQQLKQLLIRGVGVHNAGMLPNLKEIVEHLFGQGLIKVLYATETFAVGINMPARSVCFASLEKYDGRTFRFLNTKEYFQLAGRAGRRGIDSVGYAISLVNRQRFDFNHIEKLIDKDVEPIESQFKLSYNTVLNLMKHYDEKTRKIILQSNFGYFVKQQSSHQSRIMTSFSHYVRRLEQLQFLDKGDLTWKGEFATHMYMQEIAISQFVFTELFSQCDDKQLALLLTSLVYEGKPSDHFSTKGVNIHTLVSIVSSEKEVMRAVNIQKIKRLYHLVYLWMEGNSFQSLLDVCNLAEGDIIRLFRQVIDIATQMKHGLHTTKHYPELIEQLERIIRTIDRDLIAVKL
ncbi:MAG: DEAD/DEAH box helicase [Candidatus Woesearchaeota archaeon]